MILDFEQQIRFNALYNSLMGWVAAQLGFAADAATRAHQEAVSGAYGVAQFLWEGAGHTDLIDEYLQENPSHLMVEDLETIASWKGALSSDFALVRKGDDVFALLGDHAFCVRGVSAEIDESVEAFPTVAHTTLLPFAGHIVCSPALSSFPFPLNESMASDFAEAVDTAEATGMLARTAQEFLALAPAAREARLADDAEEFARQTELEMNADELGEGQHAGVLAGLTWEEREAEMKRFKEGVLNAFGSAVSIRELERHSYMGPRITCLADYYRRLSKDQLLRLAAKRDVPGNLATMGKRELTEAIVASEPLSPARIIDTAIARGLHEVEHLRDVVQAGGELTYDYDDIVRVTDAPSTLDPYLFVSPRPHGFIATMPREVRETLEDVDWETEVERARDLEGAVDFIERLVDFCGVIPYDTVMDELDDYCGASISPMTLVATLMDRLRWGECGFNVVSTREGALFFVHPLIADECGVDDYGVVDNPEAIQDMIILQDGRPPRPVADMDEGTTVVSWVESCQSYRDFVRYLDAHVPDDAEDRIFATMMVNDFVSALRDMVDIAYVFEVLEDHGFVATEAQTRKILLLVRDLIADVPHWYLNGWTTHELAQGLDLIED